MLSFIVIAILCIIAVQLFLLLGSLRTIKILLARTSSSVDCIKEVTGAPEYTES